LRIFADTAVRHEIQSAMPKMPAPDVIRGGYRFSENIMLQE